MSISFITSSAVGAFSGGSLTLTLSTGSTGIQAGDCIIVAYGVTRAVTMAVLSSGGTPYTQIVPTFTSTGTLQYGVWRRIASAGELTLTCSGTGNAQDGVTGAYMVFRGVDQTTPEDVTATSTTGSGTTPDSPSITVANSSDVIISAVGSLAVSSASGVTAPSGFSNLTLANSSDTRSTTTAMAWITSTSTAAYNPGAWGSFTSAVWCSATIALRANAPLVSAAITDVSQGVPYKSAMQYQAMAYTYLSTAAVVEQIFPDKWYVSFENPDLSRTEIVGYDNDIT